MPFYEYRCDQCGHEDTFLESVGASASKTCPKCGKRRAFRRLISAAGFQLKGDGWYVTDFRDKKKAAGDKDDAKDGAKDGGKDGKDAAAKDDGAAKGDKKEEKKAADKTADKADKPAAEKTAAKKASGGGKGGGRR